MAALFVIVAVAGFGPRSVAILTGASPVPPLLIHVHAALMAAWLLLFLTQTSLIATGRPRLHRTLGVVSFVPAPAVFVVMSALVVISYLTLTASSSAPTAGFDTTARAVAFVLFVMGRAAVLFGIFYLSAVLTRRGARDSQTNDGARNVRGRRRRAERA
jgi:hypothetical protein